MEEIKTLRDVKNIKVDSKRRLHSADHDEILGRHDYGYILY